MPIYSFGVNSILKIEITDEQAAGYNRFLQAFFDAQKKILDETGKPWHYEDPIYINCTQKDYELHNQVADVINETIPTIDQDITPIELDDDFLVKN